MPESNAVDALGLAPVAVVPQLQRCGRGSLLIKTGLAECRKIGYDGIVLLGHPEYYPRFGFVPATRCGLNCEHGFPEEAFMVVELRVGALRDVVGTVKYQPEFDEV